MANVLELLWTEEGDVVEEEGGVIGQAELSGVVKKKELELKAPFGVQDNGEITNATGDVVGKLLEGKPQNLLGTAIATIDADGNMKSDNGIIVGKADIIPCISKIQQLSVAMAQMWASILNSLMEKHNLYW